MKAFAVDVSWVQCFTSSSFWNGNYMVSELLLTMQGAINGLLVPKTTSTEPLVFIHMVQRYVGGGRACKIVKRHWALRRQNSKNCVWPVHGDCSWMEPTGAGWHNACRLQPFGKVRKKFDWGLIGSQLFELSPKSYWQGHMLQDFLACKGCRAREALHTKKPWRFASRSKTGTGTGGKQRIHQVLLSNTPSNVFLSNFEQKMLTFASKQIHTMQSIHCIVSST